MTGKNNETFHINRYFQLVKEIQGIGEEYAHKRDQVYAANSTLVDQAERNEKFNLECEQAMEKLIKPRIRELLNLLTAESLVQQKIGEIIKLLESKVDKFLQNEKIEVKNRVDDLKSSINFLNNHSLSKFIYGEVNLSQFSNRLGSLEREFNEAKFYQGNISSASWKLFDKLIETAEKLEG